MQILTNWQALQTDSNNFVIIQSQHFYGRYYGLTISKYGFNENSTHYNLCYNVPNGRLLLKFLHKMVILEVNRWLTMHGND